MANNKRTRKKIFARLNFSIGLVLLLVANMLSIKHIINLNKKQTSSERDLLGPFSLSKLQENDVSRLHDYKTATEKMFYDTQNLKFHLGNVASGQQVTPFGWLGTYTDRTVQKRKNNDSFFNNTLVLTCWNGQVLWANNDDKTKIYDTKYNNKTNEIYVVRANNQAETQYMTLTIHDVFTGMLKSTTILKDFIPKSKLTSSNILDGEQIENCYQDFVNLKDGTVVWYYQMDINRINPLNDQSISLSKYGNLWKSNSTILIIKNNNVQSGTIKINFESESETLVSNPWLSVTDEAEENVLWINWLKTSSDSQIKRVCKKMKLSGLDIKEFSSSENVDKEDSINGAKVGQDFQKTNNIKSKQIKYALTKPVRNMFDQNLVSIPYIYLQSKSTDSSPNLPIYNVLSVYTSGSDNSINVTKNQRKTQNFKFGEDIYNYWKTNNINTKTSEQIEKEKLLEISPWPKNNNHSNVFNRVIAISPFDNTIIYAARPGYSAKTNASDDLFSGQGKYNGSYASLWIATINGTTDNKFYKNIIIPNNSLLSSSTIENPFIAKTLLDNVNDIYNNLAFDLRSSKKTNDGKLKLSLYFNQTGTFKNKEGSALKTSAIGIINLNGTTGFVDNITTNQGSYFSLQNANDLVRPISYNGNKFALLSSQADLIQWYPRSWTNVNHGANTFTNNQILVSGDTRKKRAEANILGSTLFGQSGIFDKNESIDLVSNYFDSSFKNNAIIWNPEIKVMIDDKNNDFKNELKLKISYKPNLENEKSELFITGKTTFEQIVTIPNVSKQIFTSLKEHVKIQKMTGDTSNLALEIDYGTPINGKYNQGFGKVNNSLLEWKKSYITNSKFNENNNALRLELQIDLESNDIKKLNVPNKFKYSYPITSNIAETTFDKILKDYINWKIDNIASLLDSDNPSGLNSVAIKAFLKLNPEASDNILADKTLYKISNNKHVLYGKDSKLAIYEDQYNGNRFIYNQSSIKFSDNHKHGWNDNVKNLYKSFTPGTNINSDNKFKTFIDLSSFNKNIKTKHLLKNKNNDNLLSVSYESGTNNLKFTFRNEFLKKRLKVFNQVLSLKLQLEALTSSESNWYKIKEFSDDEMEQILKKDSSGQNFLIENNNSQIKKVRLKLIEINENDQNNFIKFSDKRDLSDSKFESKEYSLSGVRIGVDWNWLFNEQLSISNNYWNELNAQEIKFAFDEYKEKILEKNLSNYKDKIDIQFSIDDSNIWLSSEKLSNELYRRNHNYSDNDLGIVVLWNGKTGNNSFGTKIKTKFVLKKEILDTGIYELSDNNNSNKIESEIDTKNISTKVDITKYTEILRTKKTIAIPGNNNTLTDFTPPDMEGEMQNGFLFGRKFDAIISVLAKFGIKTHYKTIGDWVDEKTKITQYNISNPTIQLKFFVGQNKNVVLKIADEFISGGNSNQKIIDLKLNIPKVVLISEDILKSFVEKLPVSGNTYKINVNSNFEQEFIKSIKDYNNKLLLANSNEFNNVDLVVKYRLSNMNDFKKCDEFKKYLQSLDINLKNNEVQYKIEINQTTKNDREFIISTNASNAQVMYENGNNHVKKWIHGNDIEKQLDKIIVSGSSNNLNYDFPTIIKNIIDNKVEGIKLQYSLNQNISINSTSSKEVKSDINKNWVDELPTSVIPSIKLLKVKVTTLNSNFIYGPEEEKLQKIHDIDLSKIKFIIEVDNNWLKNDLTSNVKFIENLSLDDLKKYEESCLKNVNDSLKTKIAIKYVFNGKSNLDKNALFLEIQSILKTYMNPKFGFLQLWDGKQLGNKIEATFTKANVSDDTYEIKFINSNELSNVSVDTSKIRTLIDIKEYVNQLKMQKINVSFGTTNNSIANINFPNWEKKSKSTQLVGQSFAVIEQTLKELGVLIEYKNNQTNGWVTKEKVIGYDQQNPYVEIRFKLNNTSNITLSVLRDKDVDEKTINNDELGTSHAIKINLNIPAKINVNNSFIEWFVKEKPVIGNTKNLEINETKENEFINKIKDENQTTNVNVKNVKIYIEYQLGSSTWLKNQDLINYLKNNTEDENTNELKFRLKIENPDINNPDFAIDETEKILSEKNISAWSNIKIYINDKYSSKINKLIAVGSTDNYSIVGLNELNDSLSTGLSIQLSSDEDLKQNNGASITDYPNLPVSLNANKNLWLRFKVQNGYIFEKQTSNNDQNSLWYKINTTGLKVVIKLQSTWLEKIQLTGNTKKLEINEELSLMEVKRVLPKQKQNLVKINYTVDNISWFTKEEFKKKLLELDGAKDKNNFIIKREDIKAKYFIETNKKYILNIDNINVLDNEPEKFSKNLVSDTVNATLKGYINVNKLDSFNINNFSIRGSNVSPKIIVKNISSLNNSLNTYASDNIFEIKFTTVLKQDKKPDYSGNYQFWNPASGLIDEDYLIQSRIKLSAKKVFQIGFFAKDKNYEVYHNNKLQSEGYSLDISKNIKISIEIENPFVVNGLKLSLWFRNKDNKPKFYQNQGGFRLTIIKDNKNNYDKTAQEFLKETTSITNSEKNALEFAYTVLDKMPDEDEIKELFSTKSIDNYDLNSKWKTLPDIDFDGFINNLGLKVDQYVFVGLRVKQEFVQKQDDGFSLKNDNHSITEKNVSRVNGYKINVKKLLIDWNNMELINTLDPLHEPLDGFSNIKKISLIPDNDSNYLGIDLKLNVFNDYYKNKNEEIITINNNIKLVKRDSDGSIKKGNYKDVSGKDIKDKNGNTIPILVDEKGFPAKPITNKNLTNSINLVEVSPGFFTFVGNIEQVAKFSLFRNQKIQIEYLAKKGLYTDNLQDYYLDDTDNNKTNHIIEKEIKYQLNNDKNINYKFDESILNRLIYKNALNKLNSNPINGESKLVTPISIIRTDYTGKTTNLTGVKKLEEMLKDDFYDLLKFQFTHISIDGKTMIYDGIDVSQINTLQNGDRIIVKILATYEEDFVFIQGPQPIVIEVSNLIEKSLSKEFLQYLRVEQNGKINGKCSFRVLVNNPNNDLWSSNNLLSGYKFAIRVWDSNKSIKIDWTTNQDKINNLSNGDRIEWKLVTDKNQPVVYSYYNTISNGTNQNLDGSIDYLFAQINVLENGNFKIIDSTIGKLPVEDNTYPEKSGFTISGLINSDKDLFMIDNKIFKNTILKLNPYYSGLNGNGAMKFAYFDNYKNPSNLYITDMGEIIDKKNSRFTSKNINKTIQEVKLIDFIQRIEFISTRPNESNSNKFIKNTFKYSSNNTNINNKLFNNDLISAIFTNDDDSKLLLSNFSAVKNLVQVDDPVNKLWYVLFGGVTVSTLGLFALIYFVVKNQKIKK